ncbi:hypothetical protein, partial [Reichenbachiella sp.]|uniref:hypothetical protein n=1 Tax=Reichenbachiella sp. TaxID=2184521 RepID=UPI003296D920
HLRFYSISALKGIPQFCYSQEQFKNSPAMSISQSLVSMGIRLLFSKEENIWYAVIGERKKYLGGEQECQEFLRNLKN